MKKPTKREISRRVQAAYNKAAAGEPISIMELPRIWAAAEKVIVDGGEDAQAEAAISDIIKTLKSAA